MSVLDDLADNLARDTLAAANRLGDESLISEVAKQLGATSNTMQEAFMTSIRFRMSEQRGRRYLEQQLAKVAPKADPA